MRLTSWAAACAAALGIIAIVVTSVAVHDRQTIHLSSSTAVLARSVVDVRSGNLTMAQISSPDDVNGTKPVTPSPRYTAPVSRAPGAIVTGSYQQSLINRDRASAGLRPLTWSSCLASVAVSNAVRLTRQGWVQPYHTNGPTLDLGCHLGNQAGENVGYWSGGINDNQLNTMFMNSPEHRANIMGPYHYVGTAWAVAANGYAYIAVEFS